MPINETRMFIAIKMKAQYHYDRICKKYNKNNHLTFAAVRTSGKSFSNLNTSLNWKGLSQKNKEKDKIIIKIKVNFKRRNFFPAGLVRVKMALMNKERIIFTIKIAFFRPMDNSKIDSTFIKNCYKETAFQCNSECHWGYLLAVPSEHFSFQITVLIAIKIS